MKLYNTLTNKTEEFIPLNEGKINIYVCGPTVNKRTHLGHMIPAIVFDTIVKYFRYKGFDVTYASNFTDVDDKIIASAIEENKTEKEIADRYASLYLQDLNIMNCCDVDVRPRVTEYMDYIIEFISLLLEKGYAYNVDGDIYFDISKAKNYGMLSNQKTDDLQEGIRIEINDKKKNPYDFALWKKTDKGIKWNSPFGEGRPGWHTECVVMINKIFNGQIDIHGGGIDLKFPHHENEIAQSNVIWNNTLAKYWMHNGHLLIDGIKMSKSLGNVLIIDDLIKKYTPNTIRISILKNNYRSPLELFDELFDESKTIDDKLYNVIKQANLYIELNNLKKGVILKDEKFEEYMDDDFNTSNAITYLLEIVKELNNSLRNKNNENIINCFDKINIIINVLGLKYDIIQLSQEDKDLYNEWIEARNNKDFEKADILRNKLTERKLI